MTARSGDMFFNEKTKRWEDEEGNVGYLHKRVCEKCNKPRLDINGVEDCDFCLQGLTNCEFIDNACCGHGNDENAYISLKDGRLFILSKWSVKEMTENNDFNNIENDSTNSRNEKKVVDLNKKTIKFEMPYDGKIPRAMNIIMEEWQREIKKILDEANINEVTIRYGDLID